MKNAKEFFDNNKQQWSYDLLNEKKQYKIMENFYNCYAKVKKTKPKILDIGCGIGYDAKILSDLGAKVVGVDFSNNVLSTAKKFVANASFHMYDIINTSLLELGKFDGAICLETLDYITPNNMKQCLDNIGSVLKSGALLLVSVLDGSDKNDERSYVTLNDEKYDKNFQCYTAEDICTYAYPNFKLVDTWQFNDFEEGWRYYIFMKQIVK